MSRALLAAAFLLAAAPAAAETEVHIRLSGQSGADARLPLALPAFAVEDAASPETTQAAAELREVLRSDLLFSRYLALLEDGPPPGTGEAEAAQAWKAKGAGWALWLKLRVVAARLILDARLVELRSGETVFERAYRQDARYLRSAAHRLADDAVKALTGKDGIALTQIAFSNNSSGHKEIHLVDYDGANPRQVTRDRSLCLLPRLAPDRRTLVYTGYRNGNPDLFQVDLEKGKTRPLSAEQGLNLAGGFSPDGATLLLTLSKGRSPNLYLKSLSDGSLERLTQHFGADTSPTFSPDGREVAFVSDRSGNPQIHTLDLTTRRARRLTGLNWCDSPSWSPTGEWIAFAGRAHVKDPVDIYLVDPTGSQVRQLTRGEGSNENPSWSPDGRFIAFSSTRGGRPEIFVMDADGSAPHRLADIPGASSTPSWSR